MRPSSPRSSALRSLGIVVIAATPLLSGCALGVAAAGATVGAATTVVGATAKVAVKTTGAVIGAAIPGDGDEDKKNAAPPQ